MSKAHALRYDVRMGLRQNCCWVANYSSYLLYHLLFGLLRYSGRARQSPPLQLRLISNSADDLASILASLHHLGGFNDLFPRQYL